MIGLSLPAKQWYIRNVFNLAILLPLIFKQKNSQHAAEKEGGGAQGEGHGDHQF